MNPVTAPPNYQLSQLTAFMKGEPKALGTVQIMIGIWTFLFGIVLSTSSISPGFISGITLLGSLFFISSGALSVAAANKSNSCVVKAALGMNVVSAVAAGLALSLFVMDMLYGSTFMPCRRYYYGSNYHCGYSTEHLWNGIYGVLFVFFLLEFIISISTSGFACKATCCTETTVIYSQPMNPQPMNPQPMYTQPTNSQPMYPQPMNPPPMNPPPMYNPAFYNPQTPQESSLATYNKV
ncbi:membrane-spanning 4-domains subfamily A member 4A-like [Clarias gariepinus]|uniref:membrane-spanning 4-domains subfamily A member 4A-like n=1 Tax=Clarias gariepinus TaxID=13013 RepID=UPI00234CB2F4|nr:membrane-spanning 4-domains subfamily A member 4A-like [Clarias gariepinus]